jgi:3D (Asp-Asp-Asp) domain-containing protein
MLSHVKHNETIREVTAYNVGDPAQNSGNACISANGENICVALERGYKRCAANFVPFGTMLHIDTFGYCKVTDRMNRRYRNRVDIAMKVQEKSKAITFGLQKLRVKISN